jgi:hypothetical protein
LSALIFRNNYSVTNKIDTRTDMCAVSFNTRIFPHIANLGEFVGIGVIFMNVFILETGNIDYGPAGCR